MLDFIGKFFAGRSLASFEEAVREINLLEEEMRGLSDDVLRGETAKFKDRLLNGETLDDILPRAFAAVREAARRTLGQRPYDVQLMGGIVLHRGAIMEMMTGEGKTLAAVAPAYLSALTGQGVHIVTVNEFLARRDTVWMGKIYALLGLSVACLVPSAAFMYDSLYKAPEEGSGRAAQNPQESELLDKARDTTGSFLVQQEFLRPITRHEAYRADVTYGTNHEFGFDYLRDNLVYRLEDRVQREHYFAIIDEVDSILIDEARTPLIIAAPDAQSSDFYKTFARVAASLVPSSVAPAGDGSMFGGQTKEIKPDGDYEVDEKRKTASITDAGIAKVEKIIGVQNLYAPENIRLVHYLEESLKARALFHKDRDYVVKNGEVIIVDEFTGRMLMGRRYQAGLHQAIEAKEGVMVQQESRTYAKISIQNYFRMYKKIAGMTGTAQTSAEEFHKVYGLEVVSIPPNKPFVRDDRSDVIYKNFNAKVNAIARDVAERRKKGQPVLLGTTSVAKNEIVSAALSQAGIPHELLNAKNNEREGSIVAQAGRLGAVTVATNMAGRGVDILLGGNPPDPKEAEKVRAAGGLHVIGTERHEARRIDNQLRGRAGRQGDAGSSQFFLSLDDDLLRIFGGGRIKNMMERFNLPEDEPIQIGFVSKAVQQAQEKVEGANFDMRKHLLEYDDVLNKQRAAVYKRRSEILETLEQEKFATLINDAATAHVDAAFGVEFEERKEEVEKAFREAGLSSQSAIPNPQLDNSKITNYELRIENIDTAHDLIKEKATVVASHPLAKNQLVGILDMLWMNNLEDLEALSESVGLRAYGQRDPLVEYRQEASRLYHVFWGNFNAMVFSNIFKLLNQQPSVATPQSASMSRSGERIASARGGPASGGDSGQKVGRNDPCPCGSGRKYKHCGLINSEEHQRATIGGGSKPKHEATGG